MITPRIPPKTPKSKLIPLVENFAKVWKKKLKRN
jgi:hypothetical protein